MTTYGAPGTAYPTGTIMEPVAVPGAYGAPPTAYGAPPGAMYAAPATAYGAAPTYAAPATSYGAEATSAAPTGTYAAPTYAAPAATEGTYAAPTYAAPAATEGTYAAPTYAAPAATEGTYAAPTYAAPAATEGMYAAPTYAAPAGTYAAPMYAAPAGTAPAETIGTEGSTTEMPTYAAPAEPILAQGPAGTFTTDPQGMGTTMQPPQPKVLPTETVMGPVTQAGWGAHRHLIVSKLLYVEKLLLHRLDIQVKIPVDTVKDHGRATMTWLGFDNIFLFFWCNLSSMDQFAAHLVTPLHHQHILPFEVDLT